MKPQILFAFLILHLFAACTSSSENRAEVQALDTAYYMPAQFEAQEAVWLGWQGHALYYPVNLAMVKVLLPQVQIKIVSESDSISGVAKKTLATEGIDTSAIQFYVFPDNEFWMRDHGAAFVVNQQGGMKAVDFEWSAYGYEDWIKTAFPTDTTRLKAAAELLRKDKSQTIDSLMGAAERVPVVKSWITIEGGSIEVNGKGTLLLNEPLTLQRNKGATKAAIEQEFKSVLGVKNIIWLQHGLADDPHIWQVITGNFVGIGTGGHTDEYVKFADPSTILLAWVSEEEKDLHPINKMNYERMGINYDILKKAKDQDGKPFRIVKVPLPDPIVRKSVLTENMPSDSSYNISISKFPAALGWKLGDTVNRVAASSYLNYYVTNGMVLLPDYSAQGENNSRKQQAVKGIFQEVFPGRKLVFIDAMPLNWEGGGIHCGTQQQPKRKSN
jgi:agmatine deiminase